MLLVRKKLPWSLDNYQLFTTTKSQTWVPTEIEKWKSKEDYPGTFAGLTWRLAKGLKG